MVANATSLRTRRRVIAAGTCALGGLAIAVGCWALFLRKPAFKNDPPPDGLLLVVSGDTQGWITPCGCTANQSGGLPRRATYLSALRQAHTVVYADAGGAIDGDSPYHALKAQAILRGEGDMQIAAHNLGAAELALGAAALRDLRQATRVPLISANVRTADGALFADPIRIVTAAGLRVAFIGVVAQKFTAPDFTLDDPRQAILAALQSQGGKYDRLIILAYVDETELDALARALPEADAVIGGPTGQSIAPHRVGGGQTLVGSATRKGKFVLEAALDGRTPFAGRIVEMNPDFADAADQLANVAQFHTELGQHDFPAAVTGLAPAARKWTPVAGSASCAQCHVAETATWAATAHARAWAPLVAKGAQVDPSCQVCHTTGYGAPAGFSTIAASADRLNVGCEDCHGPSEAHVRDPRIRTPFLAAAQCITCHDEENSPAFAYDSYWAKVRHGPVHPTTLPATLQEAQP